MTNVQDKPESERPWASQLISLNKELTAERDSLLAYIKQLEQQNSLGSASGEGSPYASVEAERELISGLVVENRQLCEAVGCAEYALMTGSRDNVQEALRLIADLYGQINDDLVNECAETARREREQTRDLYADAIRQRDDWKERQHALRDAALKQREYGWPESQAMTAALAEKRSD